MKRASLQGFLILALLSAGWVVSGRASDPELKIPDLYQRHCAVCHGTDLQGGLGGSLLAPWKHVSDSRDVESLLRSGLPDLGMDPFGDVLTAPQLRGLAILIAEKRRAAEVATFNNRTGESDVYSSQLHSFRLEPVTAVQDDIFWGMDFLPDGTLLATTFGGRLHLVRHGALGEPIKATPEVWRHGQGGLMDVAAHPDFANNGWIYLSYAEAFSGTGKETVGFTTIVRGRVRNDAWVDQETIYRAEPRHAGGAGVHFGVRLVFQEGHLFFGIGDRGRMNEAQDPARPNGKIHRVREDGTIPNDNPFRSNPAALPTLWTLGNRNPQGLAFHPRTGNLWESEHGPRGGDEVNHITPGANYGWPRVTHGMNYNGTPITADTVGEGFTDPATHFTPSIAICGMDFYRGDRFPKWRHDLFVGGLASEELWRIRTDGARVIERELILKGRGRVRDVASGPDGALYLILNEGRREGPGHIFRLVPAES